MQPVKLTTAYLLETYPSEITEAAKGTLPPISAIAKDAAACAHLVSQRKKQVCTTLNRYATQIVQSVRNAVWLSSCSCRVVIPHNEDQGAFQKYELILKKILSQVPYLNLAQSKVVRKISFPVLPGVGRMDYLLQILWEKKQNSALRVFFQLTPPKASEEKVLLNKSRKNNVFCDFTFSVQGTLFPVHKVILTSASSYFNAMFSKNFKESTMSAPCVFGDTDVQADVFEALLEYIYTHRIDLSSRDVDFIIDLKNLASMADIKRLVGLCSALLQTKLSADSCFRTAQHALSCRDKELINACKAFLKENQESCKDLDFSTVKEEELIDFYDIACELHSEELKKEFLDAITSKLTKETFELFCTKALNATNEVKETLRQIFYTFALAIKDELKQENFKSTREAYQAFMTGLDPDQKEKKT